MITAQEAVHRMQEADPVPNLDAVPDDLVVSVWGIIDAHLDAPSTAAPPTGTDRVGGRVTRWRRPAIVVALAFAVTAVLVGFTALLPSEQAPVGDVVTSTAVSSTLEPTPSPTTVAPAPSTSIESVTTLPTVTAPDKPASLDISWQRVSEQPSLQDGWISSITTGGPGYVAVGGTVGCSDPLSNNCRLDAAVWVSADGLVWERIESDSFRSDAVREVADGVPTDGDQYMNDVTVGPAGLVAVGAAPVIDPDRVSGYLDQVGIWLSPDGRQWDRLPYDEETFGGIDEIWRIATFDDRLVAIGGARAWVSTDGAAWEGAVVESSPSAGVFDLTIWNGTLVAVGVVDEHPAVWASEDGLAWTRVAHPALEAASGNLQGVGGTSAGLVALGGDNRGRIAAWRSVDGVEWAALPDARLGDPEWELMARTAVSVERGTGGVEDDLVLINGSATLWGTADGGEFWHSAGEFDGGVQNELGSSARAGFNTVNQVLVADGRLLAVGKVVAWSSTEPLGPCYIDSGGSCRPDAAIWVGTWDGSP